MTDRDERIAALRQHHRNFPINTPKPGIERDLKPGFLLPYLLDFDVITWGRWDYWFRSMVEGRLLDEPLPQIEFLLSPDPRVCKMLEMSLDAIPNHGSGGWQSMEAWEHFRYLLKWMLFGFGDKSQPELPTEPYEGASMRLYQVLNICAMMLWPHDYFGDLLAENAYGKRQGFYPTPMSVATLLAQMTFGEGDHRTHSFNDPCVGTGRLPLLASNYSLILTGQDIDRMMVDATLVNSYLYAPWLVRPFPFLKGNSNADDALPVVSARSYDHLLSSDPLLTHPLEAEHTSVSNSTIQVIPAKARPQPARTFSENTSNQLDLFAETEDRDGDKPAV